jgi:hypothetical protein
MNQNVLNFITLGVYQLDFNIWALDASNTSVQFSSSITKAVDVLPTWLSLLPPALSLLVSALQGCVFNLSTLVLICVQTIIRRVVTDML